MTVSKNPKKALTLDLKSGGEEIKKVDKFRYLGSMITGDAKDITTVKKTNFNSKSKIYIWKIKRSVNKFKNIKINKNEHSKDICILCFVVWLQNMDFEQGFGDETRGYGNVGF